MAIKKNNFFSHGLKIIIAVIFLVVYLYGLRPLRRMMTQRIVWPVVTAHTSNNNPAYGLLNTGTAIVFLFQNDNETMKFRYQPQLGFFFLAAMILLVFITKRLKWFLWLIAFHILLLWIVFGILCLGLVGWFAGFSINDFLIRYLIPGFTFAYVAFVYHRESQFLKPILDAREPSSKLSEG